jgi:non-heme chloroperoxidase
MRRTLSWIIAIATLSGSTLCVQDIAGNWQETLNVGAGLPFIPCALSRTDLHGATKEIVWQRDSLVRFKSTCITVEKNVKLEVIDWGGSGRPVVLLAGLGASAHVFDKFAPKLAATYHVYGITRRGFGASSAPAPANGNYSADRLGDDVLAVVDSLKLNRPVLVGHSIAGEELSSVGSRYPDKVTGLVYLDAGYSYAYYDRSRGDLILDSLELRKKLEQLIPGEGPQDQKQLVQELLQTSLPQFEKDLQQQQKTLQAIPALPNNGFFSIRAQAVFAGQQKYSDIRVPILAIFAVPHDLGGLFKDDPSARGAAEALDAAYAGAQARAFENGLPSAHVVRIPNAHHWVFQSNEADVLREMNAFLSSLP